MGIGDLRSLELHELSLSMLAKTKITIRIHLLYGDLYRVKTASCNEEVCDIVIELFYDLVELGDFGRSSVAKIMNNFIEFQE